MNTDNPWIDPTPEKPSGDHAPSGKPEEPKKTRRRILGLPPGYQFDPKARPTLDDLYGTPACFGDDGLLRRGEGRTKCNGPSFSF